MSQTMKHSHGEVTLNDGPTKARLYRFCEKKIDQWIESHAGAPAGPIDFRVDFTEDEETRQVSCETEIRAGNLVFKGCDLASDTQQALLQCLKRLH